MQLYLKNETNIGNAKLGALKGKYNLDQKFQIPLI